MIERLADFLSLPMLLGISAAVGLVVFGLVRAYFGSWRLALNAAFAAAVVVFSAILAGRSHLRGRVAERRANQKAAEKRAAKREKLATEIKTLPDAKLKKRAERWKR